MTLRMISIGRFAVFVAAVVVLAGVDAKPPSRVVGGEDGNIAEFPYQVSVRKWNKHQCGGTIIGKRHVLTAAHCIDGVSEDPASEMTVVTGTNALVPGAGTIRAIKSATVYPSFQNNWVSSWHHDIAVIALTDDIRFDVFTKPARLPTNKTGADLLCVASGWGAMSYPKILSPNNVRKIEMLTITDEECHKRHWGMKLYDSQLCAFASLGVGLCTGDSGGPLVHNGTIVAVASFVHLCATGTPDVFTRVHTYLDFINETIATT